MKEVLSAVAKTVNQEPSIIDVDVKPSNSVHRLLQQWKILPATKTYTIHPVTLGTLVRISEYLLSVDMTVADINNILNSTYEIIQKNGRIVARILALAIHNKKKKPSEKMVDFIYEHFTCRELVDVMQIVFKQMDVTSFTSTIVSMKGMSVLESAKKTSQEETSPQVPGPKSEE